MPHPFFFYRTTSVFACLVLLLLTSAPAHAFNELLVGTFVDAGVDALSRGGLEKLPRRREFLDFNEPLYLDSGGKYRIEAGYEGQLTAKIYNGRWKGSFAESDRLETSVAAPFTLYDGALKGNLAAGYGFDSFELKATNHVEEIFVHADQKFEAVKGGIYLQAFDRLSLGVSVISTQYRDPLEVPLEIAVSPVPWFTAGYRHLYHDFSENLNLRMSGHDGNLPLKILEQVDAFYGVLDYGGVYLRYENEMSRPDNRWIEARLALPASLYLVGEYQRRDLPDFNEEFTVDGTPGGFAMGTLRRQEYRAGVGGRIGRHWNLEANYRHSNISADVGGIASTRAVAGFWPSLVVGNYNYISSASLASDQYHLTGEYQGDRFSFSLGTQYLDLKPAAGVDYWRSLLLGLGRAGADSKQLSVDRIGMLFLSAGMGYKWKSLELKYAVGQFIPLFVHDRDAASANPSAPDGGKGGGRDFFSRVTDTISHYPGGGLHRLLLSIVF